MKTNRILFIASIVFALLIVNCYSQSIGISTTSFTPDPSAILDVSSTTQGALMPRMTTIQRDAITTPATGLLIFNTTTNCLEMYVSGSWNTVSCPANCIPPSAPSAGTHTPSQTQIIWNWNPVEFATGYKWNRLFSNIG